MIQKGSVLRVLCNSGAKYIRCIDIYNCGREASIGDIIRCSVISATPDAKAKKGKVFKAVLVWTKSSLRRADGSIIAFDANAAVLVDSKTNTSSDISPIGTRIKGILPREVSPTLRAMASGVC